jgi:ketosteroid isomerase-like protein
VAGMAYAFSIRMTTQNIAIQDGERELLELEQRFWQALKDEDIETALALTDEPCVVMGPQGVASIDKQAFRMMMQSAPYKLNRFQLGDAQVRMLSDDVGIVAYPVHEEFVIDGQQLSLDALDSSTWVRRNGRWVCALHTEALKGDPFGRDRSAP